MRLTDDREADGRIAAAIRTDQGDTRCGLKCTNHDMNGVVMGV